MGTGISGIDTPDDERDSTALVLLMAVDGSRSHLQPGQSVKCGKSLILWVLPGHPEAGYDERHPFRQFFIPSGLLFILGP